MGPRAERPKRRVFTAEYKAAILAEYDQVSEPGAKGAILRREGLYTSHLIDWRRARDAAGVAGLGRPPRDRRAEQIAALQARAELAEAELAKTQAALEIVGKLHALLESISESAEPATSLTPRPKKRSKR